ncbi:SDR family NAD(P)-dependent oxidoreductase [Steroidobacter flavus]|uniref:SDR family NAD(P)-dependent oxidoreductase n=1 Tax=Steroidobacter flavus TaxID=1842136 RepID=A0ABV8T023_9GAMM
MHKESQMFKDRFWGRTAVITGGASGAGKAAAARLVAEGARVALWDQNQEALIQAQAEVGATSTHVVDVADPLSVQAAAEASHAALSRIDLLVCSAGITGATAPVREYPIDSWNRVISVNLNGVFHACRAIVPFMIANKYGRIVNVASVAGKEGNPNASAYSASKAGVIAFTKSLAKELATTGVLVNAVTPAVFVTPLLEQMPRSQVDFMKAKIPMGRFGEVPEVVAMISWLLSEECSFSTGAVFDISGGRTTY